MKKNKFKGIILAGGNGTRLRPATYITNKHLINVFDRPMIDYPIKTLADFGIEDILIVSGREHAGAFVNYLGSGKDRGLNFTYRVQEEAGGIAQALGLAEGFADNNKIAVILGDNFYSEMIDIPENDEYCNIVLKQVHDPERFGVANFRDGKLVSIKEKPHNPESNLAVTGLYFYPPDVFDIIKTLVPSSRGELEITDVNNHYLHRGLIKTVEFDGYWSDMGQPESLGRTIKWIMENRK